MERLFLREKIEEPVFSLPERLKIGFVSLSPAAGASFVAVCVAKACSLDKKRRVTLVEILTESSPSCKSCAVSAKNSLLYDSLGMDKRFAGRDFADFYKFLKDGESLKSATNVDERINWILPTPEDIEKDRLLSENDALRLVNNAPGDVIICDLSALLPQGGGQEENSLLSDMDELVCVIDPLPSKLLASEDVLEYLKCLEMSGKKIVWVVNKYNSGINKRDLAGFLRLRETTQFPLVGGELIYSAEYTCRLPYSVREINELLHEAVEKIMLRLF